MEAERDAARAEVAARDAAVAALTRRLAEAEARDPDPDPDPAERGTVTETTRVTNERFVFDTSVDASEASPSSPFARSPSDLSSPKPGIPSGLARRFFSSSPSSRTSIGRSPRSPVSPVSPVSPESHEHGGGGITAVVEDSPPSAFLGFFPASPPRELDGVPAWAPAADTGAAPGTSPPGTGAARGAAVPAPGALGVPAGFEMGGALSEDEDGGDVPGDVPGDGPAEPRTPPAARSAGDVFGASARGENAAEKTTASRSAKTPSNANMSDMSHETMPVAIDACSACAAARLRHEAFASELTEALNAARRENETLEAANGSLESRLASVESELADADAALHFERLDVDGDGRLTLDDLLRAELFASYAQPVVERIFEQWTQSAADEKTKRRKASGVDGDGVKSIDREGFRALNDWARRKTRTRESTRFWFRVVDVDGDGVLSRHDIKWLYDAVHKDESTCVSLADLTCQIFDMAGADRARTECARGGGGGVRLAALRESRLADGIFGILCNHDDMLLRRSTAEFSNEHAVPM